MINTTMTTPIPIPAFAAVLRPDSATTGADVGVEELDEEDVEVGLLTEDDPSVAEAEVDLVTGPKSPVAVCVAYVESIVVDDMRYVVDVPSLLTSLKSFPPTATSLLPYFVSLKEQFVGN